MQPSDWEGGGGGGYPKYQRDKFRIVYFKILLIFVFALFASVYIDLNRIQIIFKRVYKDSLKARMNIVLIVKT